MPRVDRRVPFRASKAVLFAACSFILVTACVPAADQGVAPQSAVEVGAPRAEVLAAIAEIATTIRPDPYLDYQHEYFEVIEVTDESIRIQSALEPTSAAVQQGLNLLRVFVAAYTGAGPPDIDDVDPMVIRFSAIEVEGRSVVAFAVTQIDSAYASEFAHEAARTIIVELNRRYR